MQLDSSSETPSCNRGSAGKPSRARGLGWPDACSRWVAAEPPEGSTGERMANKQRLTVLVVDQDEATMIDLKEYLAREGYRVQLLSDPSLAADEIRQNRYQLVFVDVSPGNQAGLDALGAIRNVEHRELGGI